MYKHLFNKTVGRKSKKKQTNCKYLYIISINYFSKSENKFANRPASSWTSISCASAPRMAFSSCSSLECIASMTTLISPIFPSFATNRPLVTSNFLWVSWYLFFQYALEFPSWFLNDASCLFSSVEAASNIFSGSFSIWSLILVSRSLCCSSERKLGPVDSFAAASNATTATTYYV